MNPMELIDDCTDVITDFVSDDVETGDYIDSDITILDKED
jgi:hypothetical protein